MLSAFEWMNFQPSFFASRRKSGPPVSTFKENLSQLKSQWLSSVNIEDDYQSKWPQKLDSKNCCCSPGRWLMLMPQAPSAPTKCPSHFFLELPSWTQPQLPHFAWDLKSRIYKSDLHLSPSLSCPVDPLTSKSCLNFALNLWLPKLTWKSGPSSSCLVALTHGLLGPGFHSKVSWDWNQRTAKTTKNKNWRWMTYKTYMAGQKHPKIILTDWASAQNCSQFSIWGKYATREQRMREGSSGSHRLVAITVTGPPSNTNNKSCKARSGTHTSKQNRILLFPLAHLELWNQNENTQSSFSSSSSNLSIFP